MQRTLEPTGLPVMIVLLAWAAAAPADPPCASTFAPEWLETDGSGQSLLVSEGNSVSRIDPLTGARTTIAGPEVGQGLVFVAQGVAVGRR